MDRGSSSSLALVTIAQILRLAGFGVELFACLLNAMEHIIWFKLVFNENV